MPSAMCCAIVCFASPVTAAQDTRRSVCSKTREGENPETITVQRSKTTHMAATGCP